MAPAASGVAFIFISLFVSFSNCDHLYHLLKLGNGNYRVIEIASSDPVRNFRDVSVSNGVAKCLYNDQINQTGWAFLEVHSNESESDMEQVYGAGYLEGYTTKDLIYMHWYNTLGGFCEGDGRAKLCQDLDKFIEENQQWIQGKVDSLAFKDAYWHHVKLFYEQIRGLSDGYSAANKDPNKNLTFKDLLWLNLQGDFDDLNEVFKAKERNFKNVEEELPLTARGLGHCSALIKVLPDGSDLFVAQDTWSSYQSMLRIEKKYILKLHRLPALLKPVHGRAMSFSSYPGVIGSGDDFYLISSGLATLETTIGNGNASLWRNVKPSGQIFEAVRSMIANRLAHDGRSWTKIFSRYNSGTYNNQWMIVDYNIFNNATIDHHNALPDGILWVLEQLPGYIYADDMTKVLRAQSYWPSYNVAAFPQIFNMSGNQEMVRKFGDWFTYEKTPRALIFKRDHLEVRNLMSMFALMRYNDFKHDPLSKCNCNPPFSAENAIAARCDLNPANGTYPFPALGHRQHGATDAKITNTALFNNKLSFLAVSGPIHDHSRGIPPFQWSTSDFGPTTSHLGHPDKWEFQPIVHDWTVA